MKFSNPALFALTMLGSFNINLVQAEDLTLDFESGTLEGWTQTGEAFSYQPTKGDNPTARQRGQISNHRGEYWIGTYEKHQGLPGQDPGGRGGDHLQGTLTSLPFAISHDFSELDFLVGGGRGCYVQLLVGGVVKRTQGGYNHEEMRRVSWDIADLRGETGVLRMLDEQSGGWGHINVDDFRFLNDEGEVVVEGSIHSGTGGAPKNAPTDALTKASSSGDPHFKTWSGAKYDYHGECDLVLLDNPSFNNGQGLKVHIRTTRVQYYSYIEKIAVKIGDDVLEFANDAENFVINGSPPEPKRKHHQTLLGGFILRRDRNALSIRLTDASSGSYHSHGIAKIDLVVRQNGFPAVVVDAGDSNDGEILKGSLGLLGDWPSGNKVGRDGVTVFEVDPINAENFALEWQVRDTEPMLFQEARFPQFPNQCTPPKKIMGARLGKSHMEKVAEKACADFKGDQSDCLFDVIATRSAAAASQE